MKVPFSEILHDASSVAAIERVLCGQLRFGSPAQSFSPWFSDIGLGFGPGPGIAALYLHYNRMTSTLGEPLLSIGTELNDVRVEPLQVHHCLAGGGSLRTLFYGHNTWLVEGAGVPSAHLAFGASFEAARPAVSDSGDQTWCLRVQLPTRDPRDADIFLPMMIALRAVRGDLMSEGKGRFGIEPDERGRWMLACAVSVLDCDADELIGAVREAPEDADEALAASRGWLARTLHRLPLPREQHAGFGLAARAALALAMNATSAPGQLGGRVVVFPNRGEYPAAYLWDSCFQNLALETMAPQLASDALLVLTDNLRVDGMMAHFLCSTWRRPHVSQPPLVGWAALRLVRRRGDRPLARTLLAGLAANTRWWLSQRGSAEGLIFCRDPMETGWDNTPRLDRGPILALDMSSYVISQQRACAELARMLGRKKEAEGWDRGAERMGRALLAHCYDAEDNLFYDVLVETGEQLPLKTPAAFLPLWAGVPLPAATRGDMIRRWLLNPKYFFGDVPFPSVAYDEADYRPDRWWRGPTWPSVAWLMMELLEQEGFGGDRLLARDRLLTLWTKDGQLRELFDSRGGVGLGSCELGWTAAVFLALLSDKMAQDAVSETGGTTRLDCAHVPAL